eukprot:ctg_597.g296
MHARTPLHPAHGGARQAPLATAPGARRAAHPPKRPHATARRPRARGGRGGVERHVTDVLAFGFPDPPVIEEEPGKPLMDVGTVIVAVPFVYRRFWRTEPAATPAADFHRHLTGIAVHGLCHLFGYLHDTEQQQESMQRMEDEVDAQLFGTAAASTATRV